MNSAKFFSALALIGLPVLAAAAGDRVVLADRPAIEEACKTASSNGIACHFISAQDIDQAESGSHLWAPDPQACSSLFLRVPPDRMSFLDRASSTHYCAQALIYPRTDSNNQPYFMARLAVLSVAGSQEPRFAEGKDDIAWNALTTSLATDDLGGERANSYLVGIDEAAGRRDAEKAAAKADADAKKAYLASDEYRREQSLALVASCRKTIAQARRAIADDERVAQISGYENKMVREQSAVSIVRCQDIIASGGYRSQ